MTERPFRELPEEAAQPVPGPAPEAVMPETMPAPEAVMPAVQAPAHVVVPVHMVHMVPVAVPRRVHPAEMNITLYARGVHEEHRERHVRHHEPACECAPAPTFYREHVGWGACPGAWAGPGGPGGPGGWGWPGGWGYGPGYGSGCGAPATWGVTGVNRWTPYGGMYVWT